MKHLVLLLALVFVGCGTEESDWERTEIPPPQQEEEKPPTVKRETPDPTLNEYVEDFLYDCGTVFGQDVSAVNKLESVRYGNPATEEKPNRVGVCQWWTQGDVLVRSLIVVKRPVEHNMWFKALMYHELAHCVLRLGHTAEQPKTMMSPTLAWNNFYEDEWDRLLEEMCTMDPATTVH